MSFLFCEATGKLKKGNAISLVIIAIVVAFMIPTFSEEVDKGVEKYNLCLQECTKDTLDYFDECIDLGVEDVGFLSSEHYYLCDKVKVTKTCIEWEELNENCSSSSGKKLRKDFVEQNNKESNHSHLSSQQEVGEKRGELRKGKLAKNLSISPPDDANQNKSEEVKSDE